MNCCELLYEAQFHGSNRLAERKNRYCWCIILILILLAASSVVWATVSCFLNDPAYLTITESKELEIEFPSVIICPEISYPQHRIDKFLEEIYYPPGLNSTEMKATIQQLAAFYSPDVAFSYRQLRRIEIVLDYNGLTVEIAGKQLTASCEETLLRCRLFGFSTNCSNLFSMELTNSGFCCIFNGRSIAREMKSRQMYQKHNPNHGIIYTTVAGHIASLITVVNNTQEVDDLDITYKWLYLESGQQFAETGGNGTPISPSTEVWVGYETKKFVIADEIRSLSPELGGCRLSTTKLDYFPFYSKRYCMLECEMANTIKRCQCAKLHHPRPRNVPYCRASSLLCAKNAAVTRSMCDCPPTCDSGVDIVRAQEFPLQSGSYVVDMFYQDLDFSEVSVVRAFISHHKQRLHTRKPYYTPLHLLSQLGGVFGVFFGCSVLTLVELIQLTLHGYQEYKTDKVLNRKIELILPPRKVKKKKKARFKKTVVKGKVVVVA